MILKKFLAVFKYAVPYLSDIIEVFCSWTAWLTGSGLFSTILVSGRTLTLLALKFKLMPSNYRISKSLPVFIHFLLIYLVFWGFKGKTWHF